MGNKTKINLGFKILGWILIGIGIIGWLANFALGTEVEYVTHQMYYALKEIGNLIIILIGTVILKGK